MISSRLVIHRRSNIIAVIWKTSPLSAEYKRLYFFFNGERERENKKITPIWTTLLKSNQFERFINFRRNFSTIYVTYTCWIPKMCFVLLSARWLASLQNVRHVYRDWFSFLFTLLVPSFTPASITFGIKLWQ